jgi:hypothetical protein
MQKHWESRAAAKEGCPLATIHVALRGLDGVV